MADEIIHEAANEIINRAYTDVFEGGSGTKEVNNKADFTTSASDFNKDESKQDRGNTASSSSWASKVEKMDALNSGRFHSLQNMDEEVSETDDEVDKDESDDEEMDVEKIYWFEETKLYAHASGMRYDAQNKNFMHRTKLF